MSKFVDVETARAFAGLRLVVLSAVPSMWSEAAKALFHVKGIDFVAARVRLRDDVVRGWTGVHNAPVALYLDEPPRSHWADILALAERLSSTPPLLPSGVEGRARGSSDSATRSAARWVSCGARVWRSFTLPSCPMERRDFL